MNLLEFIIHLVNLIQFFNRRWVTQQEDLCSKARFFYLIPTTIYFTEAYYFVRRIDPIKSPSTGLQAYYDLMTLIFLGVMIKYCYEYLKRVEHILQ